MTTDKLLKLSCDLSLRGMSLVFMLTLSEHWMIVQKQEYDERKLLEKHFLYKYVTNILLDSRMDTTLCDRQKHSMYSLLHGDVCGFYFSMYYITTSCLTFDSLTYYCLYYVLTSMEGYLDFYDESNTCSQAHATYNGKTYISYQRYKSSKACEKALQLLECYYNRHNNISKTKIDNLMTGEIEQVIVDLHQHCCEHRHEDVWPLGVAVPRDLLNRTLEYSVFFKDIEAWAATSRGKKMLRG